MNEEFPPADPIPPRLPPHLQPPPPDFGQRELGENEEEREAIPGIGAAIEAILRQPRRVIYQLRQPGAGGLISAMLLIAIICSLIYGLIVGSFSGHSQYWAAPLKIAGGLLISAIICLPSLYIFACLSGSQARLVEIVGMVSGLLMLMAILLIGFAPVAWLFSQSSSNLCWMGALHLIFWSVATLFGLRFLTTAFSHSNARSNAGLNTWVIIFILVVLQMTTALRPIVGPYEPNFLPEEKKFFLTHWADCLKENAKVKPRKTGID